MTPTFLVFTYGTLKRNQRNAHYLKEGRFHTDTLTRQAAFSMVDLPSRQKPGITYPAVLAGGGYKIHGELYEVNAKLLSIIDSLEDEGVRYQRNIVALESGHEAYIYLNIDPDISPIAHSQHLVVDPQVPSISWE